VDVTGRLDADPVNAPAPANPLDPRNALPSMLPHNGGEQRSLAGKLTVPLGARQTLRLFGLHSVEQRLLYDPAYKYDLALSPARRTVGSLASAHLQHASGPSARLPLVADLRVGYFNRDFVRGTIAREVDYALGAISTDRYRFVGEEMARAQDVTAAAAPIVGLLPASASSATPWGVPAFFLGSGSRGEVSWNHFRELRSQLDVTIGAGQRADLYFGGEVVSQRVETFQRVLGSLPVGDSVPGATASTFTPLASAAYGEAHWRLADLGFTAGLRLDRFDTRADLPGQTAGVQQRLNPRLGVSTVLRGATVVASLGSFSQAPDYQYLVDAAFDDTVRTGRFRQGNPNLGFEGAWQYELSVRGRVTPLVSLRANTYLKRLQGLVASVPFGFDPDSTLFNNSDAGTVKGMELLLERELRRGWGVRVSYTLQQAQTTSTSAFVLRRLMRVDPLTHDTIIPAKAEFPLDFDRRHSLTLVLQGLVPDSAGPRIFGVRPFAGLEAALIGRYGSGLPYTRLTLPDTLIGPPNDARLPSSRTIDLLLRRPLQLAGARGSVYLDMRNVINQRNIVALRRDTGKPELSEDELLAAAEVAYLAHPETIPYESPRYRGHADLNGNGYVEGRDELYPMFLAAARDYNQPLFAYGQPRLVRLGVEFLF
jgi:hypothetical protein